MGFLEVLILATALLQRERRISCRALKRIFELDDDGLADLTFELVRVKRLAVDEDGVLVWGGAAAAGRPETSPPVSRQEAPRPITTAPEPETSETDPVLPQGERRHLTVMFCDQVGSTELSTRFDPEDLQDIIRGFQELCAKVVAEFDGFVAKYMGDGVLIYFGYPKARQKP